MTFYLLRLPLLAIEEVFRSLDLMDRYYLSETSKLGYRIVQNFHRNSSFYFRVAFEEKRFLTGIDFSPKFNSSSQFVGESRFREAFLENYKLTMDNCSKLFKKPQLNISFMKQTSEFIEEIMSHVELMGLKLFSLSINTKSLSKNFLEKILKNYMYQGPKSLKIEFETGPDIDFDPSEPVQVTYLELHNCHWLRPHHLNLFHGSRFTRLLGFSLAPEDFIDFLTQWCEDSKLEVMQVGLNEASLLILEERFPTALPVERVRMHGIAVRFPPGQAYILHQKNGRRGCAYCFDNKFGLTTHFELEEDLAEEAPLL